MATTPAVVVTGTVIETTWGNSVRSAVTENPAYLAAAAGDEFYAGAGPGFAITRLTAGARGTIKAMGASSVPAWVGPGTDGQVLTSNGAGADPAFESLPGPWVQIAEGNVPDGGDISITGIGAGHRMLHFTMNLKKAEGSSGTPSLTFNNLSTNEYVAHILNLTGSTVTGDDQRAAASPLILTVNGIQFQVDILFIQDPAAGEPVYWFARSRTFDDDGMGATVHNSRWVHGSFNATPGDTTLSRIDWVVNQTGWDGTYTLAGWQD